MENTNGTVTVISVKDTIEAQKKSIDTAHEEYLKNVKSLAADYAVHGIPANHETSIEHFIEPVRARYASILNDNALHFSASIRNQLGALDIFGMRQKIKDLRLKANADSSTLETLKAARKKYIGQQTGKEFERLKLMLNVFTCVETIGYILSFISIGDNLLLSVVWGLIISLLQTVGLKSLALWMRDGAGASLSGTTKKIVWGGVALVATGLGLLRYATIQTNNDNAFAHSIFAPAIFILISYFLISVLALYIWHNYPKPEELANLKKAAGLDEEIAAKETELKACLGEIHQLTEDCNTVAQVHTLLIQASKDFYHRVHNHFLYAVGIFKSVNRISRTDNVSPDCFSQPVLPLEKPNYDAWKDDELDTNPITQNV